MKGDTLKIYQSFMEHFVGPLAKNEKLVLALVILALGGGLYTVADLLGITHKTHDDPVIEEVIKAAPAIKDLPLIIPHHEHPLPAHTHPVTPQKNWKLEINKAQDKHYKEGTHR